MKPTRFTFSVLCLLAVAQLSACGIKPGDVDPPQGEKADRFPRTYPDLSTDPQ